jgi:hypothetical protein
MRWTPALLLIVGQACSDDSRASEAASSQPAPRSSGALLHLEARTGRSDTLWGEASYKVKRVQGVLQKKLEVDVVNGPPGSEHAVSMNGVQLGSIALSARGKGELELLEDSDQLFPKGFVEPSPGAVLRVGELLELRFVELEKLVDLQALFTGPGALEGKATYRIQRLGTDVTREFQVKVERAPASSLYTVELDGVTLGELEVDASGQGKLKLPARDSDPFPATFPEVHAGTRLRVGELFDGTLAPVSPPSGR